MRNKIYLKGFCLELNNNLLDFLFDAFFVKNSFGNFWEGFENVGNLIFSILNDKINSLKSDFTKFLFFIFKDLLKNITSIYTTFSKNKFAGSVFKDHISWSVKDIFGKDNDINTRTKHFKNLLYNTSIGKLVAGYLWMSKNGSQAGASSTGSSSTRSNGNTQGSGAGNTNSDNKSVWDMKPNLTLDIIEQKTGDKFKSEYIQKINNIAKSFLGSSGLLEIIK